MTDNMMYDQNPSSKTTSHHFTSLMLCHVMISYDVDVGSEIAVNGCVSYMSQKPWVRNTYDKKNVRLATNSHNFVGFDVM